MTEFLSPEFQAFLTKLLVDVILLIVPVLVVRLIAFVTAQWESTKAKFSNEQQFALEMLASMAVRAAEQSGFAGYLKDDAAAKRSYAIDFVKKTLATRGFNSVGVDEIVIAIEAAINQGLHRRVESLPSETELELL